MLEPLQADGMPRRQHSVASQRVKDQLHQDTSRPCLDIILRPRTVFVIGSLSHRPTWKVKGVEGEGVSFWLIIMYLSIGLIRPFLLTCPASLRGLHIPSNHSNSILPIHELNEYQNEGSLPR
jgi:hypothetical protein